MKDLDAKFPMDFSPRNSQLTLRRPPPLQGVFTMMVHTGRLRPKGASFYGGQAGCQSGHLRSLTAKFKFQLMAKQINNFERAWRDRNKCEIFWKSSTKPWFLNFRPFVTIFRNKSTCQNATSPKTTEFFKSVFHICFYLVTHLENYLFVMPLVEI